MDRRLHRRMDEHRRVNRWGNCRLDCVQPVVRAIQWLGEIMSGNETAIPFYCSGRVFFVVAFVLVFRGQGY